MPYTELITTVFGRGNRFEQDTVLVPGDIVVARNNQYSYGETQYWGALLLGDYNLFDGGTVLITQSVICYSKAHSIRVPDGYPEDQFPAFYSPEGYRFDVLNLSLFKYVP